MNFYLLYGTDTSIIGREIDIIKEKLSISDNDVIYYNIEDIQNVVDEALTISMFSANKLIVIDSTIYLSQKKEPGRHQRISGCCLGRGGNGHHSYFRSARTWTSDCPSVRRTAL